MRHEELPARERAVLLALLFRLVARCLAAAWLTLPDLPRAAGH